MALASSQIVDRVAEILSAAGTAASTRVYTSRAWPLSEADLPAILVYAEGETVTPGGIDWPWIEQHDLSVSARGHVQASADMDDVLNDLAEEVLQALFGTQANAQLQPLTNVGMTCSEIDRVMLNDGPADIGQVTVSLAVRFHTYANNPSVLI